MTKRRPLIEAYVGEDLLTPLEWEEITSLLEKPVKEGAMISAFFARFGRTEISCDPAPHYSAYDWMPVNVVQATALPSVVTLTHRAHSNRLYKTSKLAALTKAVREYNKALAAFLHERAIFWLKSPPKEGEERYDLPKDGYAVLPPPYNKWSEILTRDYGKILVFPFRSPLTPPVTYFELGDSLYITTDGEWPRHLAYGELLAHLTPCEVP